MIRWIAMLTLGCTACAPAPAPDPARQLCEPVSVSCPFVLEFDDYWRELPAILEPDEVVVEAVEMGGSATTSRWESTERIATASGELERACTEVKPVVIRHFRVVRVLSGALDVPEFRLWIRGNSCGQDHVRLGLKPPPMDGAPAYLVIRPAPAMEGIPNVYSGITDMPIPLMTHRWWRLEPPTN